VRVDTDIDVRELLPSPLWQTVPAPSARWAMVAITVLCLLFAGGVWAAWATVEKVRRAPGEVSPAGRTATADYAEDGGVLDELLVREGESVIEGQPLLRIRAVALAALARERAIETVGLRLTQARLRAEIAGSSVIGAIDDVEADSPEALREADVFRRSLAERASRRATLQAEISGAETSITGAQARLRAAQARLGPASAEVAAQERGVRTGTGSERDSRAAVSRLRDIEADVAGAGAAVSAAQAARETAVQRLRQWEAEDRRKLEETLRDVTLRVDGLRTQLEAAEDRVARADVRSPVAGVVKAVLVRTLGQTVPARQPLIEIVPSAATLIVEARFLPRDRSGLVAGQPARVRITAFDRRLPPLAGQVLEISPDAIAADDGRYFRVRVATLSLPRDRDGHILDIVPGLEAEVDVVTGVRPLLDDLLAPFLLLRDRAFTD
jgi:adhesin transport system membrane fusion protein